MRLTLSVYAIAVALMLPMFASCNKKAKSERRVVAVSIPPQAEILKNITGDSIDIITLLSTDSNPESFEPSTSNFVALNDAAVYFTVGTLPFEKSIASSLSPSVDVIDTSSDIHLLHGTHGNCTHHHHGNEPDAADSDPHIWTSIPNAIAIAKTMSYALSSKYPSLEQYFNKNTENYISHLDSLHQSIASKLQATESGSFLVWHPSLSYFARDYGLKQIAVGSDNKEMSVSQLSAKIKEVIESGIATMVLQDNYDSRTTENIVKELSLKTVNFNPMDGDWESQIEKIANAIE